MIHILFFQKYWMSVDVYWNSSFGCEKRRDLWQNNRVDSVVRVSRQSSNHTIGLIKLKREVVSKCTVPFFTTVPPKTDVICITIQYLKSNVLLRSKLLQFGKIIFVLLVLCFWPWIVFIIYVSYFNFLFQFLFWFNHDLDFVPKDIVKCVHYFTYWMPLVWI